MSASGLEGLPLFASLSPGRPTRPLSERLASLVRALRGAPRGLTTLELARVNGSMAVHSDIAELRHKGYVITCARDGKTEAGRALYRYTLVKEPA